MGKSKPSKKQSFPAAEAAAPSGQPAASDSPSLHASTRKRGRPRKVRAGSDEKDEQEGAEEEHGEIHSEKQMKTEAELLLVPSTSAANDATVAGSEVLGKELKVRSRRRRKSKPVKSST